MEGWEEWQEITEGKGYLHRQRVKIKFNLGVRCGAGLRFGLGSGLEIRI